MELVSILYDKDFNLQLQFPVFIEPYTPKPLALYHLEAVSPPIKDKNSEANSYTWLQSRKIYLAMTEEIPIALTSELSTCDHIGHEYLSESVVLLNQKT